MNYFYYIDKGYVTEQGDFVSYEADYYDGKKFITSVNAVVYALQNAYRLEKNEYFDIMTSSGELIKTIDPSDVEGDTIYLYQLNCDSDIILCDKIGFFAIFNKMVDDDSISFDFRKDYDNYFNNKNYKIFLVNVYDVKAAQKVKQLIKEMEEL